METDQKSLKGDYTYSSSFNFAVASLDYRPIVGSNAPGEPDGRNQGSDSGITMFIPIAPGVLIPFRF